MPDDLINGFLQRLDALRPLAAQLDMQIDRADNSIEFHDGFSKPAEFSTEYVHFYTNYLIAVGEDDILDIQSKIAALKDQAALDEYKYAIEYLVSMLESRVGHLTKAAAGNVISLGRDCLPRSVPTKWGIKFPRNMGELTMPFDLAVHPPMAVASILENDFANYFDDIEYSGTLDHPVNEQQGILWNHETGHEWADDNFARLIERYKRRITNFRHCLNDGRPTALVLYINEAFTAEMMDVVRRIAKAVRGLGTNPLSMTVFLSSPDSILPVDDTAQYTEVVGDMVITFVPVLLPYPWYMWFEHKHFTLPGGREFEMRIVDGVLQSLTGIAVAVD